MFRYLSPIALILWATCSNAAIQSSDFWFHDDGDTVFIDGARGAPLHIDYIGAPLTKPLTVRVTPDNTNLKVSPSTCTFTKKDDDCRLIVQLKKQGQKVYGVNHFTITEVVEGAQGVLNAQATSDASTVGFGVGVQGKDMPKPIKWSYSQTWNTGGVSKVIITNATFQPRKYDSDIVRWYSESNNSDYNNLQSKPFEVPAKKSCYLDELTAPQELRSFLYDTYTLNWGFYNKSARYTVRDITNPSDVIFNGAFETQGYDITTCSARGSSKCASNKWASWVVGLANIGSKDLEGGLKAGQMETLRDNSWGGDANLKSSSIYFTKNWLKTDFDIPLLLIQGSTNGSGFDASAAAPSILEIRSAPPCSYYLTPDQSVTYSVQVKSFGPGTIIMPAGGQCQKYSTPGQDFTYCTGGGYKDSWYEITAVPDAGKTFKGWYSSGLCDDASTTCRFLLTSDVSISPNFQ